MDLKKLQEEFLRSIVTEDFPEGIKDSMIPGGRLNEEACLGAYRNDYTARLTSTLGDNFESLWTILGDEDFFKLCHDYIKEYPSKLYDLGEYGHKLPSFLEGHEVSYLSELANLEIEFRKLFNAAPETGLGAESFSELEDPSALVFKLTPHIFLSSSDYPLYRIWEKRGDNSEESFEQIDWSSEYFVMYNSTGTVQMKFLTNYQYELLRALNAKNSLEEALNSSGEGNEQEVGELFSFLVSNSLILNYK